MINQIRRMFAPIPIQFLPPQPASSFYAVGDIHGRVDLLERILACLDPSYPVIFVGDYVDRGERSADVLRRLSDLTVDPDRIVHCLMGNHEEMLLGFLDDPENRGKIWLRNGGLQTLSSFGVAVGGQATMGEAARQLGAAMGVELIHWLRSRPFYWRSGNVAVVHAGANPAEAIEKQTGKNLVWGHSAFRTTPRADGVWVIHGHRIVDEAIGENGIISIDTGAYATGRLTAVGISDGKIEFFTP